MQSGVWGDHVSPKNLFLHQARATPAPGGEKKDSWRATSPPNFPGMMKISQIPNRINLLSAKRKNEVIGDNPLVSYIQADLRDSAEFLDAAHQLFGGQRRVAI